MATYAASDLRTRRGPGAIPAGGSWSTSGSSGGFPPSGGVPGGSWGSNPTNSGPAAWDRPAQRQSEKADDDGKMTPQHRFNFCLLVITAVCLHADQNLAAPNLSAIAEDFQMTPLQKDTRLGGMVQFGFFLIGGACSLFVGPLTDQVDRVTLLMVVVLSGCMPSMLMSLFVPSTKAGFFYFFLARICTGIAIGGSFPVLFSLSADIFPPSQRAFVSACISAATNVGAAVGGLMAGVIGPRYGWRVPYRIVALPAFACAALVRVLLVDPRTAKRAKAAREAQDTAVHNPAFSAFLGGKEEMSEGYMRMEELDFGKFKKVLHVRTNMLVFMQSLPGCIPLSCIVTFLSDYLSVEQGMQVQASTAVTAVFGVSCLGFALTGGMVGNRLYSTKRDMLPVLMGVATCCAALPFILLVNSPKSAVTNENGRPTFLAFFFALLGGCAAVTGPNIRAILMNVNDGEVRGTVFSAFTLTDDLGKGLGPSIIVAMTAIFGRRAAYTMSFCCWWISGIVLLSLRTSLPSDAARGGGSLLPMKRSA